MYRLSRRIWKPAKSQSCRRLLSSGIDRILFLVFFIFLSCTPVPPKVIDVSEPEIFKPSSPNEVKNIEQAIAAVMTAATNKVGLPTVGSLSLWLYGTTESFTYWGRRETEVSKVEGFPAFTSGSSIHLNLEALGGRPWGAVVGLLAHEYGHVVHNSLGGYDLKAPHWFREGFAEWIASRVLDSLSWRSADLAARRAKLEMSAHRKFDPLVFHDKAIWDSRRGKPGGWVGTYTAAFLAVERLINKNGFASVVEYLKTGQFESSFGQSYPSFEKEFQNSIIEPEPRRATFSVDKPEWKVGFHWQYRVTRSDKTEHIVQDVLEIDTSAQVPAYLLKAGNEESVYGLEKLDLLETRMDGILKTRRHKSNELFAWPLRLNKEWRNTFKLENLELKQTVTVDRVMTVSGIEDVRVPAGTFNAIKIEAYDYKSGRLVSEYWFSPEVRWYVKTVSYQGRDTYFREQQLTAFKIK